MAAGVKDDNFPFPLPFPNVGHVPFNGHDLAQYPCVTRKLLIDYRYEVVDSKVLNHRGTLITVME